MIKLHNLCMNYNLEQAQLNVLNDAQLSIAEGETLAIVGPSGSGKTTLLTLLAGLEQPYSGDIMLDGVKLNELDVDSLADIRRDKLGIIFQSFHLVQSLTALGNVALPLEIAGNKNSYQLARKMLDRVGLAEREKHYPAQLSGGEQQRVAIARALVHKPKLVLADEPTGNLDVATGATIIELLFSLNMDTGSTLVLVTHDDEVARRCKRIVRLQNGKLVEDQDHAFSV
ncbi:ABC transporter ATP-binding protein [Neptunomonas antarctica]|uniref:Putative ABC transport system ATP-binding protein n=1 Tax=Neptunomonas antarctica TaxID=619304 RepID=A0A1N7JA05_9GAMM|nr:ABC transporter ATP-binding protein [Neptunomonas antarctica]SIS46168.1 putative ABC transport system ATP-binding protein [Neptunomonas antarctica]